MTWIGRKKLAFVPLFRPNAHPPDQIPTDWENQILRRVLFDPNPTTGADRSLRAYIHAASSGRADLDAVVMPRESVDQQDVPVAFLEGKLGAQLRSQGFNAAAIVMLGGFGAGSALTVIPIANMIQSSGYEAAFLWFGLGQGIVVILVALLLRAPEPGEVVAPSAPAVQQSRRDYFLRHGA